MDVYYSRSKQQRYRETHAQEPAIILQARKNMIIKPKFACFLQTYVFIYFFQ